MRFPWAGFLLLAAVVAGPGAVPAVAAATVFTVDTFADAPDLVPGDAVCADAAGRCSLRAAIDESNALAGADEIVVPGGLFDIFGPALILRDDVRVSGAGMRLTRIRARNQASVLAIDGSRVVVVADLVLEGGRSGRGAGIDNPAGTLTLTDVLLRFNRSREGVGGALYNGGKARLEGVAIIGNVGRAGGAVYNDAGADLVVLDTTMRRNRHRVPGGGGCLYNAGTAQVERSLLARCQGRIGDGGGGILNAGTLALTNITVWGSRARISQGGAIVNLAGAEASIESATIIRNQAAFVAAGIVNNGQATIHNSILWGNFSRERDANCGGLVPIVSLGNNIDGGTACGFNESGDNSGVDPKMGRDRSNGGLTRTRSILPGSPAVDAGDSRLCPTTDQRGEVRPVDGDGDGLARCDIGAYELESTVARAAGAAALVALAPPVREAAEFAANAEVVANQHVPAVAALPDGELLVVWQAGPGAGGDGDGYGIFARRFDPHGSPAGPELRLNDAIAGDQTQPAVAAADDVIVTWTSAVAAGPSAVMARRFDRSGTPLGPEQRLDDGSGRATDPAVARGADGSASVVWLDETPGAPRLLVRTEAEAGAGFGPAHVVDDGQTAEVGEPAIAVAADGRRIVVWSGEQADRPGIFARTLAADGPPLGPPVAVWQPDGELPDLPVASVATDATGRALVVWQIPGEDADGERDAIVAQLLDTDMRPLGARITVSRAAPGYRARPRVAMSPGGHFLVVWESETDDDLAGAGVVARRFDETGRALGAEFRISSRRAVFQIEPAVTAHASGAFQVVWTADGADGDGLGVFGHTTALEGYLGVKAKPSPGDGNALPRGWNLQLDDLAIDDGAGDDPENYRVKKVVGVLNPTLAAGAGDGSGAATYLRHTLTTSQEGAGDAVRGRLPATARQRARRWEVDNRFGTIVLESGRLSGLLVPSTFAGDDPAAAATLPPYICRLVKPMQGEEGGQVDGGRLRRDLQVFARDRFDDCRGDLSGATSFAGTPVAGRCLFTLDKPVELCNPVALAPVAEPRSSRAAIDPVAGDPAAPSLLCYAVKLATRVSSADAGVMLGKRGQLRPKQTPHRRFTKRFGDALAVEPGLGFPAPRELDTTKATTLCMPTRIHAVALLE